MTAWVGCARERLAGAQAYAWAIFCVLSNMLAALTAADTCEIRTKRHRAVAMKGMLVQVRAGRAGAYCVRFLRRRQVC